MSEVYRQVPETAVESAEVSEGQMDRLVEEMTRGAQREAAKYRRTDIDDIALLLDALEALGLKLEDLSQEQVWRLSKVEDNLFSDYLRDDEDRED